MKKREKALDRYLTGKLEGGECRLTSEKSSSFVFPFDRGRPPSSSETRSSCNRTAGTGIGPQVEKLFPALSLLQYCIQQTDRTYPIRRSIMDGAAYAVARPNGEHPKGHAKYPLTSYFESLLSLLGEKFEEEIPPNFPHCQSNYPCRFEFIKISCKLINSIFVERMNESFKDRGIIKSRIQLMDNRIDMDRCRVLNLKKKKRKKKFYNGRKKSILFFSSRSLEIRRNPLRSASSSIKI